MASFKHSVWYMVLVLTVTCSVAGIALAYTYSKTKANIDDAEYATMRAGAARVLPPIDGAPEQRTITMADGTTHDIFIGRKNGTIVGVAMMAAGDGYGGEVPMLVGLDPTGAICGMMLLSHKETPGLGTKAGARTFLDQFNGKTLDTAGERLRIKQEGGTIDAITGATITSRGVTSAASAALNIFAAHKEEIFS